MTKEEFNKTKENYSKKWAEILCSSFEEYEWDKFIQVEDYSAYFGSTRRRYELYKSNKLITPYLDVAGNYKSYQGNETIRVFQYIKLGIDDFNTFQIDCSKDTSTRWNIWKFTLYPSGEYESEFIWDEAAHVEFLKMNVRNWLESLFENAVYRIQDRNDQLELEWDYTTEFIISFTNGKPNPALFITENNPQMTFKSHLHQVYDYIEEDYLEFYNNCDTSNFEQDSTYNNNIKLYKSLSSDDLRAVFPRWNKASLIIKANSKVRFEDVSFEWLPENEA